MQSAIGTMNDAHHVLQTYLTRLQTLHPAGAQPSDLMVRSQQIADRFLALLDGVKSTLITGTARSLESQLKDYTAHGWLESDEASEVSPAFLSAISHTLTAIELVLTQLNSTLLDGFHASIATTIDDAIVSAIVKIKSLTENGVLQVLFDINYVITAMRLRFSIHLWVLFVLYLNLHVSDLFHAGTS